ncbi:MAG: AEC family transporter [Candidatus Saccharimonadales bacterium]
MSELTTLLDKIYPLYLIVFAGYLAGKFLKVDRTTVSSLLIYVIAPVVVFNGVSTAPHENSYLLLPIIFLITGCLLSLIFYEVGGIFWKTSERNLLSFIAGTGNTGYFGIPLILALYGQAGLSIAVFSTLGVIVYESTRGYYVIAKSNATTKEALYKVLRLPVIYAFVLGIIFNRLDVHFGTSLTSAFTYFNGAYTVFGMMILGIGLAAVTRATFDKTFTVTSFIAKFLAFPIVMGLLTYLDATKLHLFDSEVHKIVMILTIVPMATNTVTYATQLKAHPEKAAFTVFLSTLFALVYIPIFISVFLK